MKAESKYEPNMIPVTKVAGYAATIERLNKEVVGLSTMVKMHRNIQSNEFAIFKRAFNKLWQAFPELQEKLKDAYPEEWDEMDDGDKAWGLIILISRLEGTDGNKNVG